MIGRIIDVSDPNRHLSVQHGFMLVKSISEKPKEIGRVALDDIAAVIVSAPYGISYSNSLLVALAVRGAPLVVCGSNFSPVGSLITNDGNFEQSKRIRCQISAQKPLNKRVWAEIVKHKLLGQGAVLDAVGQSSAYIKKLAGSIKSGDSENLEAQGARYYWKALFGKTFKRDRSAAGINSLLNYGYIVMRSAMARAIVASGLHPSIGLHHCNASNPMLLVDDLMEPFRALVDYRVWQIQSQGLIEVNKNTKGRLIELLYIDIENDRGVSPTITCMNRLSVSLAKIYMGEDTKLDLVPIHKNIPFVWHE